jgi:hypothetical protein
MKMFFFLTLRPPRSCDNKQAKEHCLLIMFRFTIENSKMHFSEFIYKKPKIMSYH